MDAYLSTICRLNRIGLVKDIRLPQGYSIPAWAQKREAEEAKEKAEAA